MCQGLRLRLELDLKTRYWITRLGMKLYIRRETERKKGLECKE